LSGTKGNKMIGVRLVNLLIPGDPEELVVAGAHGDWVLAREPDFAARKAAVLEQSMCHETYRAEHPVDGAAGPAAVEGTVGELLPLCLGTSYLSGSAVTVHRSLPWSDLQIIEVPSNFPRERSAAGPGPVVNDEHEFRAALAAFLAAYPTLGRAEKVLLLVHHWLDALACWSLEDLYLSATTGLQVIAATEEGRQGAGLSFLRAVTDAAVRFGVPPLAADFKNMRNDLVHDGTVSGTRHPGKSADDCRAVAAGVFGWLDAYLHAALNLGPVRRARFDPDSFAGLKVFSL
jgi:hypothetical protein